MELVKNNICLNLNFINLTFSTSCLLKRLSLNAQILNSLFNFIFIGAKIRVTRIFIRVTYIRNIISHFTRHDWLCRWTTTE